MIIFFVFSDGVGRPRGYTKGFSAHLHKVFSGSELQQRLAESDGTQSSSSLI